MSQKGISVEDTLCMIQESDSEDNVLINSFSEPSESKECDGDNNQDSDFVTKLEGDSSILQSLSRKRAWYTIEYKIFESQSGHKWTTKNKITAKTMSASILR